MTSQITCPVCQAVTVETMPADRCVFFWECPACHVVSKPKAGDCCVYCSYGDQPCPPVHENGPWLSC